MGVFPVHTLHFTPEIMINQRRILLANELIRHDQRIDVTLRYSPTN